MRQEIRNRRLAEGLCCECGRAPHAENRQKCAPCLREASLTSLAGQREAEREWMASDRRKRLLDAWRPE